MVIHSTLLVPSRWRVFLITLSSQTDMPSLTTVSLTKGSAFKYKRTVHTKSPSSSFLSFLDITPALQEYLQFIVSFTRHSHPNTKSPFSLHTVITPFLLHYHSFRCMPCQATKHSFAQRTSLHFPIFHSNHLSPYHNSTHTTPYHTIITEMIIHLHINPQPPTHSYNPHSHPFHTKCTKNTLRINTSQFTDENGYSHVLAALP